MKILPYLLFIGFLMLPNFIQSKEMQDMKIKINFNNKEVIVTLENNAATQQFVAMLPAEFNFQDFAGQEKISYFPEKISLKNTTGGMIAQKGKMFIYAPWGNFGIFYKNVGFSKDSALIELGTVESGIEYLQNQKEDFTAKIEILN